MPITFKTILKSKRFVFSDEFYDDDKIKTYVRPFLSIPKLKKRTAKIDLKKVNKLFKKYIIENGKPDIIHVHTFLAGEIAFGLKKSITFLSLLPNIQHLLEIFIPKTIKQLAKKVFTNSECNIAVSQF